MGKTKEELKREKQLNRSLSFAAKGLQEDLNVLAFQGEDHIIKNGEKSYVCIFSIKCMNHSSLNFNLLTSLLCANLAQRFRISSFYQKVGDKLKDMHYLSVFFCENEYYVVHDALLRIKEEFFPVFQKYGFQMAPLSLSDILIFWNLNMNSQMVYLDDDRVFTSRHYQSFLEKPKLKKTERTVFEYKDNFCTALKLISIARETKNFPFEQFAAFHKVFFAADTWKMTEEDIKAFNRILRSSFYSYKEREESEVVNFSVSLVLMNQNKEELLNNLDSLYTVCEEKGYILVPCFEEEEDCFFGLSSFGIMNYFNMHTAGLKQVTNFYEEN